MKMIGDFTPLVPPAASKCTFGALLPTISIFRPPESKALAMITETAIGTCCMFSERRRAVTSFLEGKWLQDQTCWGVATPVGDKRCERVLLAGLRQLHGCSPFYRLQLTGFK